MLAFNQTLCNDAWTHDYHWYDNKLIRLWTWQHEELGAGTWAAFYSTAIYLSNSWRFSTKMTPVPLLQIVGTSSELNHWYLGLQRAQWSPENVQPTLVLHFKSSFLFLVQNAPTCSKFGAWSRTELVSCLLKKSIMEGAALDTEISQLDLLHRRHPVTAPRWDSLSSWERHILSHMFVETVCMPACLLLHTCGHGSDWNTWFQLSGWVSEYFWRYSVYGYISVKDSGGMSPQSY